MRRSPEARVKRICTPASIGDPRLTDRQWHLLAILYEFVGKGLDQRTLGAIVGCT